MNTDNELPTETWKELDRQFFEAMKKGIIPPDFFIMDSITFREFCIDLEKRFPSAKGLDESIQFIDLTFPWGHCIPAFKIPNKNGQRFIKAIFLKD